MLEEQKQEQEQQEKQLSDQDLRQKMKSLESKKRQEAMASAPVSLVLPISEETISFDQWWILLNMTRKMRPHMKEILAVDFKARGVSKQETKEKFDATLKIFGL